MKTTLSLAAAVVALLTAGCTFVSPDASNPQAVASNNAAAQANAIFRTARTEYADSITVAGGKGTVNISGQYPDGGAGTPVQGVARAWIAGCLLKAADIPSAGITQYTGSGDDLAKFIGTEFLSKARKEMSDAPAGAPLSYEYDATFGSLFRTQKVVSLWTTTYVYTSGAHGLTTEFVQSFRYSDGLEMTNARIFTDPKSPQLLALIRSALWSQYFSSNPNCKDFKSLDQVLQVAPAGFALPTQPAVYTEKGLRFTYQQYEITFYAAGLPQCVIPYSQLKPYMTSDAVALIP